MRPGASVGRSCSTDSKPSMKNWRSVVGASDHGAPTDGSVYMGIGSCPLCWIVHGNAITPFEQLFPARRREEQILAADQHCVAVVDVAPIGDGHCLVVTREHRCSMAEADLEELES